MEAGQTAGLAVLVGTVFVLNPDAAIGCVFGACFYMLSENQHSIWKRIAYTLISMVAGYGVGTGYGGLQSQFLIEANRFALLNTLNGVTTTPFVVEGGQVFMNSAVIKQADIVNLIVTGVLQSSNYVAGQSGIRLNFVTGEFEMNGSVPGQGRMTTTHRATKVYDGNGVLRVQLGDLSA